MSLSDFELEIMQLLWQLEEATAPQLHKLIAQRRAVKYTTVKTIIDRLEKKAALQRSRTEGRTIFYAPLKAKHEVRSSLLRDFINKVFLGKSQPLAAHILEEEDLSVDDIEYLEKLLKERKQELQ